jgi:hypothetical protein
MTELIKHVASCKCAFTEFWAILFEGQWCGVPTRRSRYIMVASVHGRVQNWFLEQASSLAYCMMSTPSLAARFRIPSRYQCKTKCMHCRKPARILVMSLAANVGSLPLRHLVMCA